jgi:hypothetical protein
MIVILSYDEKTRIMVALSFLTDYLKLLGSGICMKVIEII